MRAMILASLLIFASASAPVPAQAQSARRALTAGHDSYLQADYRRAAALLGAGLDPGAAAPDESWHLGLQRLVDVLIELRHDSLAATWLRWGYRTAPGFDVDENVMPPAVVRAAHAARRFADSTSHDPFTVRARFAWPASVSLDAPATIRLAADDVPITARVGADQFMRGGESRFLPAGSYPVVVSAPGYLPTRLTTELLPGVTTIVTASLLPETAGQLYVAARPWHELLIDGERIGYTTIAGHRVAPGRHTLRLSRAGQPAIDTVITVRERERVRLSWGATAKRLSVPRLDSAIALLDAGEVERSMSLLHRFLETDAASSTPALEASALERLAEAAWALRWSDSAHVHLRRLVAADPFRPPPANVFNPELLAAYASVRGASPVVAIDAPRDTVLSPLGDALPIRVAVGAPGEVQLHLRLTTPRPRDSLVATVWVDSVAAVHLPLTAPSGAVLPPGAYALQATVAGRELRVSGLLQLDIGRLPVDTLPHEPALPAALLQAETRRGAPTRRTVLESLALLTTAMAVPLVVADGDARESPVSAGALLVGATAAVLNLAYDRPGVPIASGIAHNDSLRARRQERDREIIAENMRRLAASPLRIRTSRSP